MSSPYRRFSMMFLAVSFSLTACGPADVGDSSASSGAAVTSNGGAALALKPTLGGNLNRQGPRAASSAFSGFVLEEDWSALEPQKGQFDFSDIDKALASARSNQQHVKLRVYGGLSAPSWAMNLDGPAFWQYDHMRQQNALMPRFWGAQFQAAWGTLWDALAAKYDADPTLVTVNACAMGTHSCETMLIFGKDQTKGGTNGEVLVRNGYSSNARYQGMLADLRHQILIWPRTHVEIVSHPYQDLTSSGQVSSDLARTEDIDTQFMAMGKPNQAQLFHTGLGPDVAGGNGEKMYQWIFAKGYSFSLQSETYARLGGAWQQWFEYACQHGVTSLELPAGWVSGYSQSELTSLNQCFLANAAQRH